MTLRERLKQPNILVAPGVYDGLTANLATQSGFEALYLSGAAVAYTRLGLPDIGLSTASEMADTMTLIAERTDLPVIMDADTGFGNALNARRTMQTYERAGAAAIQIEDQTFPKRCGHLTDKSLFFSREMADKIAAVADARRRDTLIIARTDAIALEGFDAATCRAAPLNCKRLAINLRAASRLWRIWLKGALRLCSMHNPSRLWVLIL